jgi:hypothetical protein
MDPNISLHFRMEFDNQGGHESVLAETDHGVPCVQSNPYDHCDNKHPDM